MGATLSSTTTDAISIIGGWVFSGFLALAGFFMAANVIARLPDFLGALLLQTDFAQFWFPPWLGIAGPTLVFTVVAFIAAAFAWDNSDTWFVSFLVVAGLGAVFAIFVPYEGVFLNLRWLTIPAAILGGWTYSRWPRLGVAAASVFSSTFFGALVGVDVVAALIHSGEMAQAYASRGVFMVIGGAGWSDGLILAPLGGLIGFISWQAFESRTRVVVKASLQGDTARGTLFVKVHNIGDRTAKNVRASVGFGGDAIPFTVVADGTVSDDLPGNHEIAFEVERPQSKLPKKIRRPDYILVGAVADNAPEDAIRIDLVWPA